MISSNLKNRWMTFALAVQVFSLGGCATMPDGKRWGEDATIAPGWKQIGRAAKKNIMSPLVWAPIVAAVALQIDNLDEKISDHAVNNTTVFGSNENAEKMSSTLITASNIIYWTSVAATPDGNLSKDWFISKAKGIIVQEAANFSVFELTKFMKKEIVRTRPDGSGNDSFPSLHTSYATSRSMLAMKNIKTLPVNGTLKTAMECAVGTLPYLMGWARIEAGAHYPSDVLVSIFLGNFISGFINDAFLVPSQDDEQTISIGFTKTGYSVSISFKF